MLIILEALQQIKLKIKVVTNIRQCPLSFSKPLKAPFREPFTKNEGIEVEPKIRKMNIQIYHRKRYIIDSLTCNQ